MSQESREFPLERTFITDSDFEYNQKVIGFPNDIVGKRILDVGSGVSIAVEELAKRGAIAYGIDPIYSDRNRIWQSYQRTIRMGHTNTTYDEKLKGSVKDFLDDHLSNGRYIAASATNLPFRDNSLDLVYSNQCLTAFLVKDQETFLRAIAEAVRVLKSGGSLRIHPWYVPYYQREIEYPSGRAEIPMGDWSDKEEDNLKTALDYLKRKNHNCTLEDNLMTKGVSSINGEETNIIHQPRLVVIKTS